MSKRNKSNDFWAIPRIWKSSETAYILGGGPSLNQVDFDLIKDKRTIGINAAFKLGPWVDICWWGDMKFWTWNKEELLKFPGLRISCCPRMVGVSTAVFVVRRKQKGFVANDPSTVGWNVNSGASALNLAYHLGARRAVLLGFDMKQGPNGENNWHNYYQRVEKASNYVRFMKYWPWVAKEAKKAGMEILNATPGSELKLFPFVRLEDTL